MNELALSERIHRLEKEVRIGGSETERRFLEVRAEIDRLRLEMRALKTFLGEALPEFEQQFPEILTRTIHEVDPESD